jgi:hypothetical protein
VQTACVSCFFIAEVARGFGHLLAFPPLHGMYNKSTMKRCEDAGAYAVILCMIISIPAIILCN